MLPPKVRERMGDDWAIPSLFRLFDVDGVEVGGGLLWVRWRGLSSLSSLEGVRVGIDSLSI